MAPFGELSASIFHNALQITPALANFDISLISQKIEQAPKEYEGIGHHLAPRRVQEAESGPRHILARKLGFLFRGVIPKTPELMKAFGIRASQIASSKENPKGSKFQHGAFQEQVGADATTLWAAATSGEPALACHLLACMFSVIFEPEEAISIWVEIVHGRINELKAGIKDETDFLELGPISALLRDVEKHLIILYEL